MNDPTPDPAGQVLCTGRRGGHAPIKVESSRLTPEQVRAIDHDGAAEITFADLGVDKIPAIPIRIPTLPRFPILLRQAITGEWCIGQAGLLRADGTEIPNFYHYGLASLVADPPFPEAPDACIALKRMLDGSLTEFVTGMDGLHPRHVAEMLRAWEHFQNRKLALRRGPNDLTRSEYRRVWEPVRRRYPQHLRYGDKGKLLRDVVEALNEEGWSVVDRTVWNWTTDHKWPLYEPADEI